MTYLRTYIVGKIHIDYGCYEQLKKIGGFEIEANTVTKNLVRTRTHAHTHACMHAHTYAHTRTRMHTYAHTYAYTSLISSYLIHI